MKAIISGATKGIGKAILLQLCEMGFDVAFYARNQQQLTSLVKQLHQQYPKAIFIAEVVDASEKKAVLNFVETIKKQWKSVDLIVNNVGLYQPNTITSNSEELSKTLNINLFSAVHLTTPFIADFKQNKKGAIVNICSVLSKEIRKEAAFYTISKHALLAYNNVLREELRNYNIKVCAVLPGSVNTSSWDGVEVQHEKLVQPNDIAKVVKLLLESDANSYLEEIIIRPIDKKY